MEKLRDTCQELERMLNELGKRCQDLVDRIHRFEQLADSFPLLLLHYRLMSVSLQVDAALKSLELVHKGEGYLCIFLSIREGILVCWVDKPELVEDKASWSSFGYKVLSLVEFACLIKTTAGNLDFSNWAKVVQWVNTYARKPVRKHDMSVLGF